MTREQYPLAVAEAITIHKSQGSTLNSVTVQIGDGALERSLLYVACSRAKTISGLYLVGEFKSPRPPHPAHSPTIEMNRLRTSAVLIPKFQHLRTISSNIQLQVVSHNAQSVPAHLAVINSDNVFKVSHCLAFQEIWMKPSDSCNIPLKREIVRSAICGNSAGSGSIIYGQDNLNISEGPNFDFSAHRIYVTCCKFESLDIINIYKSPQVKFELFKECLEKIDLLTLSENVICCGDYNETIEAESRLVKFMKRQFNLDLMSPCEPTTDTGSTIDAVFGRLSHFQCQVEIYESFTSFHKPLIMQIRLNDG